jgi:hypothetical protein
MITADARFAGTWRLVSYEMQEEDGPVVYPFGPHAVGLLLYTEDGVMSGQLMQPGRDAKPGAQMHPSLAGYIAYCGRYLVDEVAGEVVHHVEASLYPPWVGSEQRRRFAFAGQRLTLSASRWRDGKETVHRLVWERALPLPE